MKIIPYVYQLTCSYRGRGYTSYVAAKSEADAVKNYRNFGEEHDMVIERRADGNRPQAEVYVHGIEKLGQILNVSLGE